MAHNSFLEKHSDPPTKPPDLAGSARIKAGSHADMAATQLELAAWLVNQPCHVRDVATRIIGHLNAARIGARVDAVVMVHLVADVANLERIRAEGGGPAAR